MIRKQWAVYALLVALVLGGLLGTAACSQPTATPSGGGGYPPAGEVGATVPSGEGYPRAATEVPTAVPEGYVAPDLRTPAPEATE